MGCGTALMIGSHRTFRRAAGIAVPLSRSRLSSCAIGEFTLHMHECLIARSIPSRKFFSQFDFIPNTMEIVDNSAVSKLLLIEADEL